MCPRNHLFPDYRGISTTAKPAAYWACFLAIIAFFVFCWQNVIPFGDELQQFPRALHTLYPGWLANDLCVGAPQGDHWVFFRILAGFFWLGGLTWGPILARFALWTLMASALITLARVLQLRPLALLIGVALFVVYEQAHLGGEAIIGEAVARHLAYPIALFALAASIRSRFILCAALLGLCVSFHALVGMWASLVMLGLGFFDEQFKTQNRKSFVLIFAAWLLFALPGILLILPLLSNASGPDASQADRIFVVFRHPHHLSPGAWPLLDYLHFVVVFAIFLICTRLLPASPQLIKLTQFIWVAILVATVSLIIGVVLRTPFFLKLHPFRFAPPLTSLMTALLLGQVLVTTRYESLKWASALAATGLTLWLAPRGIYHFYKSEWKPSATEAARRDALHWIKEFAPPEASVLTSPAWSDVQWRGRHAAVSSYKLVPFESPRINEWYTRLVSIVGVPPWSQPGQKTLRWIDQAFAERQPRQVLDAAKNLGADFTITSGPCDDAFPAAYSNSRFCVYQTGLPSLVDQRYLVIRYDDYAPISPYEGPRRRIETEQRLFELAERYGAKISVGVIPFPIADQEAAPRDPAKTTPADSWLSDEGNDWTRVLKEKTQQGIIEPALHGFEHRRTSRSQHRPGEYRGQDANWQRQTLRAGKEAMELLLQQQVHVFIPPWNAWDAATVHALEELDFKWLSPDQHHAETSSAKLSMIAQGTADPVAALAAMKKPSPPGTVLVLVTHPFDFEARDVQGGVYFQNLEEVLAFADQSPAWDSVGFLDLPGDQPSQWALRFRAAVVFNQDRQRLNDLPIPIFKTHENDPLIRPLTWYQENAWGLRLPFIAALMLMAAASGLLLRLALRIIGFASPLLKRVAAMLGFAASAILTCFLAVGAWRIVQQDYAVRGIRWLALSATIGMILGCTWSHFRSRTKKNCVPSHRNVPVLHHESSRATVAV